MIKFNTASLLVFIIALGVAVRLWTLHFNLLFEPDAYHYFAALQGVAPLYEAQGLLAMLSGFTSILVAFGVPLFQAFMLYAPLWGVLGIIATYLLAEELTKNKSVALASAFIYAILPLAVYRQFAGELRGETFIPVLLAFVTLAFLKLIKGKTPQIKAFHLAATVVLIALCLISWFGSTYLIPVIVIFVSILGFYQYGKTPLWWCILFGTALGALCVLAALIYIPFFQSTPILSTITEYQPITLIQAFAFFNWTIVLAPAGFLFYLSQRKHHNEIAFLALFSMLIVPLLLSFDVSRFIFLYAIPIAIFTAIALYGLNGALKRYAMPIRVSVLGGIVLLLIVSSAITIYQTKPVYTNSNIVSSLLWLKHNTPGNATVLTFWEDGSIVEGIGNRASYTDSVEAGMNSTRIQAFSRFLFARQGNFTYLENVRPEYLFIDKQWPLLDASIATEGNITNPIYNGSNLQELEQDSNSNDWVIEGNGITLTEVEANPGAAIWQISYR